MSDPETRTHTGIDPFTNEEVTVTYEWGSRLNEADLEHMGDKDMGFTETQEAEQDAR